MNPRKSSNTITLVCDNEPCTEALLLALIRGADTSMRRDGYAAFQRSYVHAQAQLFIIKQCHTSADFKLVQAAWAIAIGEGTIPSETEILNELEGLTSHG